MVNKIVPDYQAAYRRNTGCAEDVFVLNAAQQYNISKGRKKHFLSICLKRESQTLCELRRGLQVVDLERKQQVADLKQRLQAVASERGVRTGFRTEATTRTVFGLAGVANY
jgi:hypothetical protein